MASLEHEPRGCARDRDRHEQGRSPRRGVTPAEEPAVGEIAYQLCSALAGTLADAKTHSATAAVLLVHELWTDKTDDALHRRNDEALRALGTHAGPSPSLGRGL